MGKLKLVPIVIAQLLLGPIAGPVGFGAWVALALALSVLKWTGESGGLAWGILGGLFAGHTAGVVLYGGYRIARRRE